MNEQVDITDQEDNLQVLNYKQCFNESPEEIKKMRGIVQEMDTGRVLFKTFPFTEEYTIEDVSPILGRIEDWDIFHSIEGMMIRVFWYKERWYISTHRKLDAFKSRWSSRKSFGEMFRDYWVSVTEDENILEKVLDELDQSYVYFFLVRFNHENRIVCQVDKDVKKHLLFIGRWKDEETGLEREWPHADKWEISTPKRLDLSSKDEILEYVRSIDIDRYQGLILFHKDEHRHIKILSTEYKRLCGVRGNNPNIRFRYLEVRQDPDLRHEISRLYPLYQDMFMEYENILYQIAKLVRYYYIQRYIKNKYVTLPKEEYVLMKKCHDWYLTDREKNKINITKVMDLLNHEDTLSLYRMIRRYQMNKPRDFGATSHEFPCSRVVQNPMASFDIEFIAAPDVA